MEEPEEVEEMQPIEIPDVIFNQEQRGMSKRSMAMQSSVCEEVDDQEAGSSEAGALVQNAMSALMLDNATGDGQSVQQMSHAISSVAPSMEHGIAEMYAGVVASLEEKAVAPPPKPAGSATATMISVDTPRDAVSKDLLTADLEGPAQSTVSVGESTNVALDKAHEYISKAIDASDNASEEPQPQQPASQPTLPKVKEEDEDEGEEQPKTELPQKEPIEEMQVVDEEQEYVPISITVDPPEARHVSKSVTLQSSFSEDKQTIDGSEDTKDMQPIDIPAVVFNEKHRELSKRSMAMQSSVCEEVDDQEAGSSEAGALVQNAMSSLMLDNSAGDNQSVHQLSHAISSVAPSVEQGVVDMYAGVVASLEEKAVAPPPKPADSATATMVSADTPRDAVSKDLLTADLEGPQQPPVSVPESTNVTSDKTAEEPEKAAKEMQEKSDPPEENNAASEAVPEEKPAAEIAPEPEEKSVAAQGAPTEAAPEEKFAAAEAAPEQESTAAEAAPEDKSAATEVAPEQAEAAPDNSAEAEVAPEEKSTPDEAAPEEKSAAAEVAPEEKTAPVEAAPEEKSAEAAVAPEDKSAPAEAAPEEKSAAAAVAPDENSAHAEAAPEEKSAEAEVAPTPAEAAPKEEPAAVEGELEEEKSAAVEGVSEEKPALAEAAPEEKSMPAEAPPAQATPEEKAESSLPAPTDAAQEESAHEESAPMQVGTESAEDKAESAPPAKEEEQIEEKAEAQLATTPPTLPDAAVQQASVGSNNVAASPSRGSDLGTPADNSIAPSPTRGSDLGTPAESAVNTARALGTPQETPLVSARTGTSTRMGEIRENGEAVEQWDELCEATTQRGSSRAPKALEASLGTPTSASETVSSPKKPLPRSHTDIAVGDQVEVLQNLYLRQEGMEVLAGWQGVVEELNEGDAVVNFHGMDEGRYVLREDFASLLVLKTDPSLASASADQLISACTEAVQQNEQLRAQNAALKVELDRLLALATPTSTPGPTLRTPTGTPGATFRTPPVTDRTPPVTDRTPPVTDRTPPVTDRTVPFMDGTPRETPPVTDRTPPLTPSAFDRTPPTTPGPGR